MNTTEKTGGMPHGGIETDPHPYRRVYLWHWPIRITHWITALAILVLVVTGFFIGKPYFMLGDEATPRFIMGQMRFLHFAAAGVMVAAAILRVYWLFRGNQFESWKALFPIKRSDWVNMFRMIRHYALLDKEGDHPHYLGHNPLQQFSYVFVYGIALLQVFTGFYLYGLSNPGGFFFTSFAWVGGVFGSAQMVRFIHHVVTWLFLIFIPIHVYLSLRAGVIDKEGTVSSILSGSRWVRSDIPFEDDK